MHITAIQTIILNYLDQRRKPLKKLAIVFIDFEKAFDSIDRNHLIQILNDQNIMDRAEIQLLEWYYRNSQLIFEDITFRTSNGVPQGSVMSPLLFNIVLNQCKPYRIR